MDDCVRLLLLTLGQGSWRCPRLARQWRAEACVNADIAPVHAKHEDNSRPNGVAEPFQGRKDSEVEEQDGTLGEESSEAEEHVSSQATPEVLCIDPYGGHIPSVSGVSVEIEDHADVGV